jgi:hypothetical protein
VSSNARRVWNIAVAPDVNLSPGGSPLALELGFQATGGNIISASAAQNMPTRVERNDNPGNPIFGWETLTDVGGGNMQPVGIQIGTGANAHTAVAFLGTSDFEMNKNHDLLTIVTDASVTSLAWGGRFTANGTAAAVGAFANGRIAQLQGNSSANFHSYAGSRQQNTGPHFLGDINGDGNVNFGDLLPFGNALNQTHTYEFVFQHLNRVGRLDINGDGNGNFGDLIGFSRLLTGGPSTAASLDAMSVPEPVSFAAATIALALAAFLNRRR